LETMVMFKPRITDASENLFYSFGLYLEARLKADPAATGLFGTLEKAQRNLSAANERELKARAEAFIALAARDHDDFVLERLISKFELALLFEVDKNRTSPVYERFFPKGLSYESQLSAEARIDRSKFIEAALADLDHVEAAAASVKTGTPGKISFKSWKSTLALQRSKLEAAVATYRAAKGAHDGAQAAEVKERSAWLDTYVSIHVDLLKLFPGDRRKADSFFRPHTHKRRRKDDATSAA
jgi:hypothetical protein